MGESQAGNKTSIEPGTWAEWACQLADNRDLKRSTPILTQAFRFADKAGVSMESAVAMLAWLGSVAMHHYTEVRWESGVWHPSALFMSIVEADDVPIDSITSAFIAMSRRLGLDPIQDTVKEGPSGLITRLEQSRSNLRYKATNTPLAPQAFSLKAIVEANTDSVEPVRPDNVGNVRGLIYPSGRAFLSYLYDTPFFNALDELIQHGSYHVRGKQDASRLHQMNVAGLLPFYQGSMVNLIGTNQVRNNYNSLLRQMLVFWPTSDKSAPGSRRGRKVGEALEAIEHLAGAGIDALDALQPGWLNVQTPNHAYKPLFEPGMGIRYVTINRTERLVRLAVAVAFWRFATSSETVFELIPTDYAVADCILHAHEMGSRLVEVATSKGNQGYEAMRMCVSLLNADADETTKLAYGLGHTSSGDHAGGRAAITMLSAFNILTADGKLEESYTSVSEKTVMKHRTRWVY